MNDTIKGALIGAIIPTIGSFAIFFMGNFSTQSTLERDTVEILSGYFDSVEKDMAYEEALQIVYKECESVKNENESLKIKLAEQKMMVDNLQSQIDQQKVIEDENIESNNKEINTKRKSVDITTLLFDSKNFDNEFKPHKDTYGNIYGNALIFCNNGSVVYNLNSKYALLEFTLANSEDMASGKKCIIQFFGDGKLIYSSNFIEYDTKPRDIKLNVASINKLKIEHFYTYDSWYNASAGNAIIANINLSNNVIEQYDNISIYQTKYMLEEIRVLSGSETVSNPLISDSYGNQYECVYIFSNNSSSELLLNGEYSIFKGKIVPSELMHSKKECQIVIETDTESQTFNVDYYTEPIDFEISVSDSKFLRIKHFYEYDSWLNSTAGDAMIVNCYLEK